MITNENGDDDWAFYWSNTTYKGMSKGQLLSTYASYAVIGRCMGYSEKNGKWIDVHGASS
jgi:hypothetical protein